jgi:hypothetical protein
MIKAQGFQDSQSNADALVSVATGNMVGGMPYKNPPRKVDGSVYLFDNWDNFTIIHAKNGKKFAVRNSNINIQRNTLESQINKDSTYIFSTVNIEKFIVNDVPYKVVYSDEGKRIYEVIYESDDFSLLKGFKVRLIAGSPNPMVNRPTDKFARTSSFYLKEKNTIRPYKISKSKILKLLEDDPKRQNAFKKFMKENKLSYKTEADIKKAFIYSDFHK